MTFLSQIELSSVPTLKPSTKLLFIRRSQVPAHLEFPEFVEPDLEFGQGKFLIKIPSVARYLIIDGGEIVVDPHTKASPSELQAYLLGSALAVACHQRGIIPLHCSAVDVRDGCILFMGPSGAGKSTLAALLRERGHHVIADDVCYLRGGNRAETWISPGLNRLRLWKDTLIAMGYEDLRGFKQEFAGYEKFLIPIPATSQLPRRLRGIYYLSPSEPPARIVPVKGVEAVELLFHNVYRLFYAKILGKHMAAMQACVATSSPVPSFRFYRPLSFDRSLETLRILEDHLETSFT
jgi:hypothetical protein